MKMYPKQFLDPLAEYTHFENAAVVILPVPVALTVEIPVLEKAHAHGH